MNRSAACLLLVVAGLALRFRQPRPGHGVVRVTLQRLAERVCLPPLPDVGRHDARRALAEVLMHLQVGRALASCGQVVADGLDHLVGDGARHGGSFLALFPVLAGLRALLQPG